MGTGSKSSQTSNHSIPGITCVMTALFLGLAAYLGYLLQMESEGVIDDSYNARLDSFSNRIVRGRILASDGTVLAQTQMDNEENETRVYPFENIFDHTVGYSTKGETEIEALANFYLLTPHVNLIKQVGNRLAGSKNPGDDVHATLDTKLQQTACTALGTRKEMVVAMKPGTGKIFAIVSKPGCDPNSLLGDWEALTAQENKEGQLLNRATQGLYPPGSAFRIVTVLEYMQKHPADYKNYQSDCSGVYENGEYRIKCYHGTTHGHQDFILAFANSCNGVFASLGLEVNLGKWNNTAGELLFNRPLPLSRIPYKQSAYSVKLGVGTWKILQVSTGQGTTQITLLRSAMITATIANGGTLTRPYFLDPVVSARDEAIRKLMSTTYGSLMSMEEAAGLAELMRAVITGGTGLAVHAGTYTVAAETGSVEFETGREAHTWFIGFAPAELPWLVVTVLVEEGSNGGKAAVPIARQLFDIYMGR